MGRPYRRAGLVPVLTAGAAGAAGDDVDIRLCERRCGGCRPGTVGRRRTSSCGPCWPGTGWAPASTAFRSTRRRTPRRRRRRSGPGPIGRCRAGHRERSGPDGSSDPAGRRRLPGGAAAGPAPRRTPAGHARPTAAGGRSRPAPLAALVPAVAVGRGPEVGRLVGDQREPWWPPAWPGRARRGRRSPARCACTPSAPPRRAAAGRRTPPATPPACGAAPRPCAWPGPGAGRRRATSCGPRRAPRNGWPPARRGRPRGRNGCLAYRR